MDYVSYKDADGITYQENIFLHVGLPEAVTAQNNNGTALQHTIYNITLKTNSISFTNPQIRVRRRYSDFVWLRKRLRSIADLNQTVPALPRQHFFIFWNSGNAEFLESRRQKLQNFLRRIVLETTFLSSSALHLFLQTELSPVEMELCIQSGKVNEAITYYMNSKINEESEPRYVKTTETHANTAENDAQTHNTPVLWKVERKTLCKISSLTKITTLNGHCERTGEKKYASESDPMKFDNREQPLKR